MPYAVDWLDETSISIAQLQLNKIDQYLAQHPGASWMKCPKCGKEMEEGYIYSYWYPLRWKKKPLSLS